MQLIVDNFTDYGTGSGGRTNMLRNPMWLEIPTSAAPSTSQPRGTIGTHSLRITTSGFNGPRVSLGSDLTEFIAACAIRLDALPGDNEDQVLFQPLDNAAAPQCSVVISSTGKILLYRGEPVFGTLIAESDDPVITATTYQHVEVYFKISNAAGACEVRVDEVVVLNVSGLDTQNSAIASAAQIRCWSSFTASGADWDITDFGVRDLTGGENDDFGGDIVYYSVDMVATDSSDWTRNTGASDQAAVDDVTPDDDTTYIAASAPGDIVRFQPNATLPAGVSEITSATIRTLQRKADAGSANNQASLVSVANSPEDSEAGADTVLSLSYQYTDDHFNVDPSTGIAITPASYHNLRVEYEKTT